MRHPLTSKRKSKAIATALLLVGLAILAATDAWWPGIMLAVGIPLAVRQYLLGRIYDMGISLFVFIGTFITVQMDISWRLLLPILFTVSAIFILFRELTGSDGEDEEEREEDLNHELEEKKKRQK